MPETSLASSVEAPNARAPAPALLGTLAALRRYPVKSLSGEVLAAATVTESGIEGDRTEALFVGAGHARIGKPYRGKEHERLHLTSDPDAARALARERGVELVERRGERYFDDAPISLLIDRWLDDLSEWLGYPVEWERFRPNLFVRSAQSIRPESELVGAELKAGDGSLARPRRHATMRRCKLSPRYGRTKSILASCAC